MATWPITRDKIRRKVRAILQDFSVNAAEQDIPDDDLTSTVNNALGINTYVDSGIRQVCSEIDIIQGTFRAYITLVLGQSIYALPATAAGAYEVQDLLLTPTAGFTGNLTDQFLEHPLEQIVSSEDWEHMLYSAPGKTMPLAASSTPYWWRRYPRAAATTAEQTPQVQVWPPAGATTITNTTISPIWVGPIMGLPDDTTVLSIPAPADEAIAEWVAWRILDFRGDHGDAQRAQQRYLMALETLTATYGSRDRLYPRRPLDMYEVL